MRVARYVWWYAKSLYKTRSPTERYARLGVHWNRSTDPWKPLKSMNAKFVVYRDALVHCENVYHETIAVRKALEGDPKAQQPTWSDLDIELIQREREAILSLNSQRKNTGTPLLPLPYLP